VKVILNSTDMAPTEVHPAPERQRQTGVVARSWPRYDTMMLQTGQSPKKKDGQCIATPALYIFHLLQVLIPTHFAAVQLKSNFSLASTS
jgi:hypothetical protein